MSWRKCLHIILVATCCLLFACQDAGSAKQEEAYYYENTLPKTRWWWFATEITKPDVAAQLDWLKANNFGGVEIAWVYPLHRYQRMYERLYNRHYPVDTTAQEWLSEAWTDVVVYTKQYADSLGLSCDFTFGSAWPVAAKYIPHEEGTRIYGDSSFKQLLVFAWEWPDTAMVIDHLDKEVFEKFAAPIDEALAPATQGSRSAFFTDSWEIKLNATNKIWTDGFEEKFRQRFGYDIIPFMEDSLDNFPEVRYDYMMLLSDLVIDNFYKPFVDNARAQGAFARVQCLASPTDVIEAYSHVDLPETEALLNNPNYSRIVSSAAALSGKPEVSAEAFTCMYGFPGTNLREEQTADLKLLADAMFAQGVNQIFYHGMPYNKIGSDSADFFATVYVGPHGSLTEEIADFNAYMAKVCGYMRKGKTHSEMAVYVPFEDKIMAGPYPKERQRVWVWGQYEMRYIWPPKETEGYHPLWINRSFLEQAKWQDGRLQAGDQSFKGLYVDVAYMDIRSLKAILRLAKAGMPVCMKRGLLQPNHIKDENYRDLVIELQSLPHVSPEFERVFSAPPLFSGKDLPEYWCRNVNDTLYCFFGQPQTSEVAYPMVSGESFSQHSSIRNMEVHYMGKTIHMTLRYAPYQSLMYKIFPDGTFEEIDITFIPKDPVIKEPTKQRMYF